MKNKKSFRIIVVVIIIIILFAVIFFMKGDSGVQESLGTGDGVAGPFILEEGLSLFAMKNQAGGANNYFGATLYMDADDDGKLDTNKDKWIGQMANIAYYEDENVNGVRAINLKQGTYFMSIDAYGNWSVLASQPRNENPSHLRTFSGSQFGATELFFLPAGKYTASLSHMNGDSNFQVRLLDEDGILVQSLVNEIGSYQADIDFEVLFDGNYIWSVEADGDWAIEMSEK